jgi:hypothetical protein
LTSSFIRYLIIFGAIFQAEQLHRLAQQKEQDAMRLLANR